MQQGSDEHSANDEHVTWVTLREAATRSGAWLSAVSGWQEAGKVRSRVESKQVGGKLFGRHLVALEDVVKEASLVRSQTDEQAGGGSPPNASRQELEAPPLLQDDQDAAAPDEADGEGRRIVVERDAWQRLMADRAHLDRIRRELAAANERAAAAERERDLAQELAKELQERIELLEQQKASTNETGPTTDNETPGLHTEDVRVEWLTGPPEATPKSGLLRRWRRGSRDARSSH